MAEYIEVQDQPQRVRLKGIQSVTWEHPADRAALLALKNVPGIDLVTKAIFSIFTERSLRLMAMSSSVRASEKQFSRLYAMHREACEILDMPYEPELYVAQTPFLNASAVGMEQPFIVLNSGLVNSLSEEEMLTVIGHELGHIKSGHVLYNTVLSLLLRISIPSLLPLLPAMITQALLFSVIAALQEWSRKSELSCDRAGLLAVQNTDVATQVEMKLAGGSDLSKMDLGEFVKQAEAYKAADGLGDTITKAMNTIWQSHPFPVVRVLELINWVRSGDYDAILRGDFEKQEKQWRDHAREAREGYYEDIKDTISGVGKSIRDTAKRARDAYEDFNKRQ